MNLFIGDCTRFRALESERGTPCGAFPNVGVNLVPARGVRLATVDIPADKDLCGPAILEPLKVGYLIQSLRLGKLVEAFEMRGKGNVPRRWPWRAS